jgi:ABC-type sugar transport system ATPase subunit
MDVIYIKDLTKRLENNEVLKGANLKVNKGEIIALVGPSGSGKSTLLRCINRLIEPDSGSIYYDGKNIKDYPTQELRRRIILVHQESVMFPGSVLDNVSYGLNLIDNFDYDHIVKSMNYSGLSKDFLEKDSHKISGGEKKRVALARALVLNPRVLLLDEPTSGVDPKNIKKVETSIVDFSKNLNLTVIWVTHYVEQAIRVSDRIANLKDGVIREVTKTIDFKWEGAY